MNCKRCSDPLAAADKVVCCNCNNEFHYHCQSLTDRTFRKVDQTKWKCKTCIQDIATKQGTTNENVAENKEEDIEKKEPVSVEKAMRDYFDQKFMELSNTMTVQKDEMIKALTGKVTELEKKLNEGDVKIADLEDRMEMLENRSRIQNIEIRNMPETKNEDVNYLVSCIGKAIGVTNIGEGDIQVAHRVNSRSGKGNRPIVAHLSTRFMRNQWLQHYKNYKKNKGNLTAKDVSGNLTSGTNIYIHEHITVKTKLLLNEVRAYAKEKEIKFVWIKDALILLKRDENSQAVVKIKSKIEFEEFKKNKNF